MDEDLHGGGTRGPRVEAGTSEDNITSLYDVTGAPSICSRYHVSGKDWFTENHLDRAKKGAEESSE